MRGKRVQKEKEREKIIKYYEQSSPFTSADTKGGSKYGELKGRKEEWMWQRRNCRNCRGRNRQTER